jgi:hypothetical protein
VINFSLFLLLFLIDKKAKTEGNTKSNVRQMVLKISSAKYFSEVQLLSLG